MTNCDCPIVHAPRRVVLTGGPGAGKTAVLELARQALCRHVKVLPEAAGVLFSGGFPRLPTTEVHRAAQRAIFHVQRELERTVECENAALVVCDRGTVDGVAYWPGTDDFWDSVGTTLEEQLARYHAVIHLRTPASDNGYNRANPLRIESASEAAAIDERILAAWANHPRRHIVDARSDFFQKAAQALELLNAEVPECCRESRTASVGSDSG